MCGFIQRIYEKLTEEEGIRVGYSTLTRMIRELDPGNTQKSDVLIPDEPGWRCSMIRHYTGLRLEIKRYGLWEASSIYDTPRCGI